MGKQKADGKSVLNFVSEAIRVRRREQGLSQEKLAELAELHTTTISDIERGKSNLTMVTLERIADSLKIPVGLLLPDVLESKDKKLLQTLLQIVSNHEKLRDKDQEKHLIILKSIAEAFRG